MRRGGVRLAARSRRPRSPLFGRCSDEADAECDNEAGERRSDAPRGRIEPLHLLDPPARPCGRQPLVGREARDPGTEHSRSPGRSAEDVISIVGAPREQPVCEENGEQGHEERSEQKQERLKARQSEREGADAVIEGKVKSFGFSGVLLDDKGRARIFEVTITAAVTVRDQHENRVLYDNQNFVFRGEFEFANDPRNFFNEEDPAVQRMARSFAESIVSTLVNGFGVKYDK